MAKFCFYNISNLSNIHLNHKLTNIIIINLQINKLIFYKIYIFSELQKNFTLKPNILL